MTDFKLLQAEHESLLNRRSRLDDLDRAQNANKAAWVDLKQQKAVFDVDVHTPGDPDPHRQEREALETAQAALAEKIKSSLAESQQRARELLDAVTGYITEVKASSPTIGAPREREQLRANLRYWGSYVYEQTGSFPSTDLAPASVLTVSRQMILSAPIAISGAALVLIVIVVGVVSLISRLNYHPAPDTQTPTLNPSATVVAVMETETLEPTSASVGTAEPGKTPSPAPAWTVTPLPTLASSPTPSPIPEPSLGILAELTYPVDGQKVSPAINFSGTYANLQPRWTIHVLLQPKTRPGLSYFPLADYFTVPDQSTNGTWSLQGQLGSGVELEKPEQYNIKLVIVTDPAARAAIVGAAVAGLEVLPAGVIDLKKVTNVSRDAYTVVDEQRLLYTSIDQTQGTYTIMTSNLDGKDVRPIPSVPGVSESFPALSPDGARIAFVGMRRDAKNNLAYSIGIMDSNGDNPRFFFERSDRVYEEPQWSPDGATLVFSATDRTPFPGGGSTWAIELADARAMLSASPPPEPRGLTPGASPRSLRSYRYPVWLDNQTILLSLLTSNSQSIYQWDTNTLDGRLFLDPKGSAVQAALAPDKKSIAFIMANAAGPQVYMALLTPGTRFKEPFALTSSATPKQFPRWDPTGQTLYFELDQTAGVTLWAVKLDGSGQRQITFGGGTSQSQPFVGHMKAYFPVKSSPF